MFCDEGLDLLMFSSLFCLYISFKEIVIRLLKGCPFTLSVFFGSMALRIADTIFLPIIYCIKAKCQQNCLVPVERTNFLVFALCDGYRVTILHIALNATHRTCIHNSSDLT